VVAGDELHAIAMCTCGRCVECGGQR
jgi:hypothetical protein